uniref:Uncharacterized protein n=1 Tax=Photinus pyralis TaxID=7054 RepID=A0A1Y1KZE8_PHOPY
MTQAPPRNPPGKVSGSNRRNNGENNQLQSKKSKNRITAHNKTAISLSRTPALININKMKRTCIKHFVFSCCTATFWTPCIKSETKKFESLQNKIARTFN